MSLACLEPMRLGDKFCCQRRWCVEYKTIVICHNVNTQNVKIARRDRPHILASHRCETFENLLHVDTSPVTRTLSGIWHSKNWTMIFISMNIYVFCGKSERESWAKLPEPEMRSEGLWESLMTSLLLSLMWSETLCDPVNSVHHQKRSLLKGVAMRDWSSFRQTILSFSDVALVTSIFMYYMIYFQLLN